MTISTAIAVGSNPAGQSSNIGIQDFLKILTTQLNNQDPLKPMDNQDFVAQIAQFATLEQSRQLNVKIDSLLTSQSSTQSVGLLGKTVDVNASGGTITGKVTALSLSSGQPMLTITTAQGEFQDNIPLSAVITIR
ncbi:MAG: flagellar hook capping FlgD N-terminal domain-containing protein [Telluria sp.]